MASTGVASIDAIEMSIARLSERLYSLSYRRSSSQTRSRVGRPVRTHSYLSLFTEGFGS